MHEHVHLRCQLCAVSLKNLVGHVNGMLRLPSHFFHEVLVLILDALHLKLHHRQPVISLPEWRPLMLLTHAWWCVWLQEHCSAVLLVLQANLAKSLDSLLLELVRSAEVSFTVF